MSTPTTVPAAGTDTWKPGLRLPRILTGESPVPWLAPLVAFLLLFALFPLLYNIWLSFHEYDVLARGLAPVGLENWSRLISEPRTANAIVVTLAYVGICLTVQLALGLAIALLLDSDDPGYGTLRALMTLPLVVPPAITALLFLFMEDPQFGVISWLLDELGILGRDTPILSTTGTALFGVILADIWQWTPFMVLIFLAGLRALPREPFEAAAIDGASRVQMFLRLTLPMLSRVMAVAILVRGIDLFRFSFAYIYTMTSGGPGTVTETIIFYAWKQTFSFIKWGYGATLSLAALIALLVVCNLFIYFARVRW